MKIEEFLASQLEAIDKKIEESIPRLHSPSSFEKAVGSPSFEHDVASASKSINEPIWEFLDRGGKRWRPALMILVCKAFGGDFEKAFELVALPEVVHNGTLVLDDVEDDSKLRRGFPCMHLKYGIDIAVNVGTSMLFLPMLSFLNSQRFDHATLNKIFKLYVQEMINLSYGQGLDIYWHRGLKCDVSEGEYLQMCAFKTGTLSRFSARLGAIVANASSDEVDAVGAFGESIGIVFQIQDDVLNLIGEEFAEGKGAGDDIREGKRSLVVIRTLQVASEEDKKALVSILSSKTSDPNEIAKAISILKKYDGIEYSKNVAERLLKASWDSLDKVLKDSGDKELLHQFANYLLNRKI